MKAKAKLDNNISKILHQRKMTQAVLAEKLGLDRSYLNRIINRKVTPTVPLGKRIANALELPLDTVFFLI